MAQGPSVASFILHLGLCGLVQGSTQNPMDDGMRGLSQEFRTYRLLKGVGTIQEGSHRIREGTSQSIWAAKHQNRTAEGRPSGQAAPLCGAPTEYLVVQGWGQSRGEQSQVEHSGISASYHPLPLTTVLSAMATAAFAHSRSMFNTVFWRGKNPLPNTWLHFTI